MCAVKLYKDSPLYFQLKLGKLVHNTINPKPGKNQEAAIDLNIHKFKWNI